MPVETEHLGRVLVITIRREHKRNAIDASVTAGLDAALNDLEDDPGLWCGVLTGGPRVFSAGADLAAGPGDPTPRGGIAGLIRRDRAKPLIAAVEGYAVGGGMEMVLCCDLVVAARTAAFGLPEVKRGLMPDFGGAFRAARMLPANIAREMLLTGDSLPAERGERLGFVNLVTEPGGALAAAIGLANRVAGNAPLAVREALAVVNAEISGDEERSWARSDAAHARLVASEDVREGIEAFFGRRAPLWQGR
jgi:enoyl-CoA hydratase/carnithine racemase